MEIQMGYMTEDRKKISKSFKPSKTIRNAFLKKSTDILHPILQIQGDVFDYTYMHIPAFKRYYYITAKSTQKGITEIEGKVDVLKTYETLIKDLDVETTESGDFNTLTQKNVDIQSNAQVEIQEGKSLKERYAVIVTSGTGGTQNV